MTIVVTDFDHLVLNVRNVAASAAWYERVLGMRSEIFVVKGQERVALRFGRRRINLRPLDAGQETWFTARTIEAGSADLCFLTGSSPEKVVAHLEACGVAVELGPTKKEGAVGTLDSVYCRDPDGSLIEISSYAGHPTSRHGSP